MAHQVLGEARQGATRLRSSRGIAMLDETYHFIVRADSKAASRLSVLQTPGLPIVGVTVSAFGYTVCRSKNATRREQNPLIWDVTCEFSSEVDERQSGQDPTTSPTEWIPVYETKFERLQEVVTEDLDDPPKAVANSAGQPFEVGLTIGRFIPAWEFFQFEPSSVTDETIIERNETVNSATFKGRPAKTLLLTIVSSVVGFYYGTKLRLTAYSIKYNSREWKHRRLDVGTVYLDGGEHQPYLDADDNIMLGGLDGSGNKVTPGDPPAVLEFEMFPAINFYDFLRI